MDNNSYAIIFSGMSSAYILVILLTTTGGWYKLSQRYAGEPGTVLYVKRGCSAYFSWIITIPYRAALTVRLCNNGLVISVFWLFRPLHPVIFLPWPAIAGFNKSTTLGIIKAVNISVKDTPVSIKFYGRAAKFLLEKLPLFVATQAPHQSTER